MESLENLKIELLPGDRTFSTPSTPSLWDYAARYPRFKRVFLDVGGAKLYCGIPSAFQQVLADTMKAQPDWKVTEPDWTIKNLLDFYTAARFVITPDGQIFCLKPGSCFYLTAIKAPKLKLRKGDEGAAYRYMTDHHNEKGDQYRKPEWQQTREMIQLLEDKYFQPAWQSARKEWVKEKKKSGEWDKAVEARKAKALANKTNRKMKVCMKVKETIEVLEQYLKDINDGTATQRQVGEVYQTMIDLVSLNKRVKGIFPKE